MSFVSWLYLTKKFASNSVHTIGNDKIDLNLHKVFQAKFGKNVQWIQKEKPEG